MNETEITRTFQTVGRRLNIAKDYYYGDPQMAEWCITTAITAIEALHAEILRRQEAEIDARDH